MKIQSFPNGKLEYWTLTSLDGRRIAATRYRFNIGKTVRREPYAVEVSRQRHPDGHRSYAASAFYYTGIPTHPHVIRIAANCAQDALSEMLVHCIEYARVGLPKIQKQIYMAQYEKIKELRDA